MNKKNEVVWAWLWNYSYNPELSRFTETPTNNPISFAKKKNQFTFKSRSVGYLAWAGSGAPGLTWLKFWDIMGYKGIYTAFARDVTAAMLVEFKQRNLICFFCLWFCVFLQHWPPKRLFSEYQGIDCRPRIDSASRGWPGQSGWEDLMNTLELGDKKCI